MKLTRMRSLAHRSAFARRVFRRASRRFVRKALKRLTSVSHVQPFQPDFFGALTTELTYNITPKFRRKRPKARKTKGLQYKMQLKVRATDRKLEFRSKAPKENGKKNDDTWSVASWRKAHWVLLRESLIEIRELCEIRSPRVSEVMAWIEREGSDQPFAFDTCVAIAPEFASQDSERVKGLDLGDADASALRLALQRLVRAWIGEIPPHWELLERGLDAAAAGDLDAIEWIHSTSRAPLSFLDCCKLFELNPRHIRRAIKYPKAHEIASAIVDRVHRLTCTAQSAAA